MCRISQHNNQLQNKLKFETSRIYTMDGTRPTAAIVGGVQIPKQEDQKNLQHNKDSLSTTASGLGAVNGPGFERDPH